MKRGAIIAFAPIIMLMEVVLFSFILIFLFSSMMDIATQSICKNTNHFIATMKDSFSQVPGAQDLVAYQTIQPCNVDLRGQRLLDPRPGQTHEGVSKEEFVETLANSIRDCWWMVGNGNYDLNWGKTNTNPQVCTMIEYKYNPDSEGKLATVNDVQQYLATHYSVGVEEGRRVHNSYWSELNDNVFFMHNQEYSRIDDSWSARCISCRASKVLTRAAEIGLSFYALKKSGGKRMGTYALITTHEFNNMVYEEIEKIQCICEDVAEFAYYDSSKINYIDDDNDGFANCEDRDCACTMGCSIDDCNDIKNRNLRVGSILEDCETMDDEDKDGSEQEDDNDSCRDPDCSCTSYCSASDCENYGEPRKEVEEVEYREICLNYEGDPWQESVNDNDVKIKQDYEDYDVQANSPMNTIPQEGIIFIEHADHITRCSLTLFADVGRGAMYGALLGGAEKGAANAALFAGMSVLKTGLCNQVPTVVSAPECADGGWVPLGANMFEAAADIVADASHGLIDDTTGVGEGLGASDKLFVCYKNLFTQGQ